MARGYSQVPGVNFSENYSLAVHDITFCIHLLVKNMEKKFDKHLHDVWSHKSPDTSKFLTVRPMIKSEKISIKDQQEYWSDVGMLFYLVKHSHPNLVNMTRELSKANNGANPVANKELLCVIKYVLGTKSLGLKIEPTGNSNKSWDIFCFRDSNFAGDPVSRQSLSGFTLYVPGVLVSWQSKL